MPSVRARFVPQSSSQKAALRSSSAGSPATDAAYNREVAHDRGRPDLASVAGRCSVDTLSRRRAAARLARALPTRRGGADATDDDAAPSLPRALADAAQRPLLERLARRPCVGPLLPVRRRGSALLAALHALGGAVRALALLAGLDRSQRRGPDRHAGGRVRGCRHARGVARRPRRAVHLLGAGRPPLARA